MTKTDLVNKLRDKMNCTKKDAIEAVNCVFDSIYDELVDGGTVAIASFGTFRVAKVGPRIGRNPRMGTPLSIPAKLKIKFRASASWSNAVNK